MALSVTDFITERLLEYDPTFDVGGGIATTALMINPLSVILQPLRDEMTDVENNQSILSVLESTDPNSFSTDVVDALASNVFISRKQGTKSSGTVRVRYFSPENVDIDTGLASFLDSGGNRYLNTSPVSITSSQMSLNVDGSLYYVDIPVQAEVEGTASNAAIGAIQTFENEPANVANVTNTSEFSGGTDTETNLELISRISVAVTVRALVTGRGITTTLTQNFASIEEINPRGFGDPEMQRDIVYNTHVGGMVDVWVKTPALSSTTDDFIAIVKDITRLVSIRDSVVLYVSTSGPSYTWYSLRRTISRDSSEPVARSGDAYVTFVEGADFVLDDDAGKIARIPGGNIFYRTGTSGVGEGIGNGGGTVFKYLTDTNTYSGQPAFANVRPGQFLKVLSPSSVAGVYSIKTSTATEITIFNHFPTNVPVYSVSWEVHDVVHLTYDYHPLSIDVGSTARSTARTDYTITQVPLMRIDSIEILDPTTSLPTGVFLDSTGGYGQGGYGVGPYGIGTTADYRLRVQTPNLRFSTSEDNYIDIVPNYLGYSLRVYFKYASEIATYQTFVDDPQNRVEPAILKVKHFIPVYVDTITPITYKVKTSNTSALSASAMQTAVETLINETTIGNSLLISDIIDLLYNNGAYEVDVSFKLSGEIHNTDGTIELIESSTAGELSIPERTVSGTVLPDVDNPLSQEIAHFIPKTIVMSRTDT